MRYLLLFLILILGSNLANAKQFGLGVILGSPTGISANYLLSDRNSIDAALAYDDDDLHFHMDYLWRFPKSLRTQKAAFGWFAGVGLKFRDHDHDGHHHHHDHDDEKFGPRAVAGVNHEFNNVPIEIFVEGAIVMYLIEETDIDLDFGIGARYYF